jgi:hypothetical protein
MNGSGKTLEQHPKQSIAQEACTRHDTPHHRDAGYQSASYEHPTTQATDADCLKENTQRIPTSDAFEMLLSLPDMEWSNGSSLGVKFQRIVESKEFQLKLDAYCEGMDNRGLRRNLFMELSNYVFQKIDEMEREENSGPNAPARPTSSTESLRFCRYDPTFMLGSDASRKPDCLGVKFHSIPQHYLKDKKLTETALPTPSSPDAFHWLEVLLFIRFKSQIKRKKQSDGAREKGSETRKCNSKSIPTPGGCSESTIHSRLIEI